MRYAPRLLWMLQAALLACSTPAEKPPPAALEQFVLDGQWRLLERVTGANLNTPSQRWDFRLTSAEDASIVYSRWDRETFRTWVTEAGIENRVPVERILLDEPSASWPNVRLLPDRSLLLSDWRKQKYDDTTWTSWAKPGFPIRDLTRCTQWLDAAPVVLADGTIQLAFFINCGRSDCGYGNTYFAHLRPNGDVRASCERPQLANFWAPNADGTQYFGNFVEGSVTSGFTVKDEKIVAYQSHSWNEKKPNLGMVYDWVGGEPPTVYLGSARLLPDREHRDIRYFYKLVGFDDQMNLQEVVVPGTEGLEPQWEPGQTKWHKGKLVWYDAGKQSLVLLDPKTKSVALVPISVLPAKWPRSTDMRLASDGERLYACQYLGSNETGGKDEWWARMLTEVPAQP